MSFIYKHTEQITRAKMHVLDAYTKQKILKKKCIQLLSFYFCQI